MENKNNQKKLIGIILTKKNILGIFYISIGLLLIKLIFSTRFSIFLLAIILIAKGMTYIIDFIFINNNK